MAELMFTRILLLSATVICEKLKYFLYLQFFKIARFQSLKMQN